MTPFQLAAPGFLFLLALIPALLAWRRWRGRAPVWLTPYAAAWTPRSQIPTAPWRMVAVCLAIALLALALARPQRTDQRQEVVSRGYDLMLAIDLSTSMLAEDYVGPEGPINRLEAIRPVLQTFVTERPNDRIGVVVFAARAYTLAPLTTDHAWLEDQLAAIQIGLLDDGTAIGDGLAIALAGLENARDADDEAVGKFIILLTDGANTSGSLTPPQATAIARHRGTPVYAIGAGRNGMVPFPIFDNQGRRVGTRQFPSALDIEALQQMAQETGGRFVQAGDVQALNEAFAAIDAAQKTAFSTRTRVVTTELFPWPLAAGLASLLVAAPVWGGLSGGLRRRRLA
ncbi:VWA domain-containing protein [Phenylobacterium sp.]|uniref:VWA domain-containing protein n=1 Tax=Phenylobacterium sp. TaxID=1871053 RepID=UPI00272FC42B|nr:VWA domain-containing protein [Phenylobacterium sp.]MDP2214444.1 VWA domain-containing protein [Phenylobacterium sp.]